jgi:hypothetical protein
LEHWAHLIDRYGAAEAQRRAAELVLVKAAIRYAALKNGGFPDTLAFQRSGLGVASEDAAEAVEVLQAELDQIEAEDGLVLALDAISADQGRLVRIDAAAVRRQALRRRPSRMLHAAQLAIAATCILALTTLASAAAWRRADKEAACWRAKYEHASPSAYCLD